jgi:hypothetical protein
MGERETLSENNVQLELVLDIRTLRARAREEASEGGST